MILPLLAAFSILGSIGAIILAAIFLIFPEKIRRLLIPWLVSYAIGTLLAGAFLGLIPGSLELAPAVDIMIMILISIFGFFILEKTLIWRHHHGHEGAAEHDHIGVEITSATAADRHGIHAVAAPLILVVMQFTISLMVL